MDRSIVVSESQIIGVMDGMCAESLPPDLHDSWESVRDCLRSTRRALLADDPGQMEKASAPSAPVLVLPNVPMSRARIETAEGCHAGTPRLDGRVKPL